MHRMKERRSTDSLAPRLHRSGARLRLTSAPLPEGRQASFSPPPNDRLRVLARRHRWFRGRPRQPEQCPHIVERETQLTRTPDEYEPPHISRPIAPIAPGAIWPFCQPSRHRVDGARCLLIVGIGMECGARYVDRRLSASGLSGQRGTCGKQFNERSVGVLNRAQYPRAMSSHSWCSGGCG